MKREQDVERPVQILHAFADYGVESEVLSMYGSVTRWTKKPKPNAFVDETVAVDLMEDLPEGQFDLGLVHPKCTDKSQMTSISGDPEDHENQIPRAREIVQERCDHYIIENKPRDDLRDPTRLNGKQFGIPIHYERAFETSFRVEEPPRYAALDTECSTYFSADRTKEWWRTTKGYRGDYPKEHLVKNCLPAAYVHFLMRSYFRAVNGVDAAEPSNNNGRPPREVANDQADLLEASQ